jgi:glutathione peroxidase
MKIIILLLLCILSLTELAAKECSPLLDFNVRTLNENNKVNLCEAYQGKVILVVNTASKCAYTHQYSTLEKLYKKYKGDGLVVLGFPSNDFGNQEPGTEQQVKQFCKLTYGVEFPMFAKTQVLKSNAAPFYHELARVSGTYPKWNFHKYLIDRKGRMVTHYKSAIDPMNKTVINEIERLLQ